MHVEAGKGERGGNAHPRIYFDSHYIWLKEEDLKPTPPLSFCPPPAQMAVGAAY